MGTRGLFGIKIRNRYHVHHNRWDSYPLGLGNDFTNTIRELINKYTLSVFKTLIMECTQHCTGTDHLPLPPPQKILTGTFCVGNGYCCNEVEHVGVFTTELLGDIEYIYILDLDNDTFMTYHLGKDKKLYTVTYVLNDILAEGKDYFSIEPEKEKDVKSLVNLGLKTYMGHCREEDEYLAQHPALLAEDQQKRALHEHRSPEDIQTQIREQFSRDHAFLATASLDDFVMSKGEIAAYYAETNTPGKASQN
jgi:hypothetical protein